MAPSRSGMSRVTNMRGLFCSHENCGGNQKVLAAAFNGDLSKWGVARVSEMAHMFYHSYKFNSDVSKWNVAAVTNMYRMFLRAGKFCSDVSEWDVANVTAMSDSEYSTCSYCLVVGLI